MEFSRPEYWSGQPFLSPGHCPNPGIEPRCPALQVDSLPSEPQGKPKNTGLGSLSLLQWIFLTQESNQGLLHFRQILYQLSYQGSPGLLFVGRFFIPVSISILVIHLFIFSISSWFHFRSLYFSKNLSISSKLSILLAYSCSQQSLMILCISPLSVVTSF